jgi:hypothetical protein
MHQKRTSAPHSSLLLLLLLLDVDIEAVQELESSLKEIRRSASSTALYYASLFLWFMGHHDKAREYVDHMLKVSSGSKEVQEGVSRGQAKQHYSGLTPRD